MVVSGEPSGDRIAAGVIAELGARGVQCFGMGGPASLAAGLTASAAMAPPAMGLSEVVTQLPRLRHSLTGLLRSAERQQARAAVLVNYTEFNLRLGRRLRAAGVRVLWCVAPQVWAWRPSRARTAVSAFDRLAIVLPFERSIWTAVGADVHYVGHPAMDAARWPETERASARAALRLSADGPAIALLPGSRAHEVRRHLPPMLEGVRALAGSRPLQWRLLLSGALDPNTRAWAVAQLGHDHVVPIAPPRGAQDALGAFDAAIVASGTATLESALAGVPPVVVYRTSALTAWVVRRMLRVPHVALPNLLLARAAYPELLQEQLRPPAIARALGNVLDDPTAFAQLPAELCTILRAGLTEAAPDDSSAAAPTCAGRIAALLEDWLAAPSDRGAAA